MLYDYTAEGRLSRVESFDSVTDYKYNTFGELIEECIYSRNNPMLKKITKYNVSEHDENNMDEVFPYIALDAGLDTPTEWMVAMTWKGDTEESTAITVDGEIQGVTSFYTCGKLTQMQASNGMTVNCSRNIKERITGFSINKKPHFSINYQETEVPAEAFEPVARYIGRATEIFEDGRGFIKTFDEHGNLLAWGEKIIV